MRAEVSIPLEDAVLGGTARVPTLDGVVELKIPPGTSGGRTFRLKGKGLPGKGGAGKPADPKLLELIQELKMVRSLQKRVNDRTELYGKRYPGEQASDPQIIRELRGLGDRQQRIQEIVRRIANGDNK